MKTRLRYVVAIFVAGCGSSSPPPATTAPPATTQVTPRQAPPVDDDAERERVRRAELSAAHHKLEVEQQEALAATCTEEPKTPHERCLPSCYPTEAADPRAGKKQRGAVEVQHLICERSEGAYMIADELDAKLAVRPARRFPKAHKKGSWQAEIVKSLAMRDLLVITGTWREREHPLTKERFRCVSAARFSKRLPKGLDTCGGTGKCEAAGSAVARAINVVHFRLAEARRLQSAGKQAECQTAALEAVGVARGLPRWRQYMKLNVAKWTDGASYRTRFDGTLDEETLFTTTARLGTDAESVYVACGGAAGAPTTVDHEQSFHACW